MRIAVTHAFCWPEVRRGAERFLPELAAALQRRGHEVTHFSAAWESGRSVERGVNTVRLKRRFEHQYRHEADFGRRLLPRLAAVALRRRALAGPLRRRGLDPRRPAATRRAAHGDHRPRPSRPGVVAPAGAAAGPCGRQGGGRRRRLQRDVADRGRPPGRQLRAPRRRGRARRRRPGRVRARPPSASRARRSCSPERSPSRARGSTSCWQALALIAASEPEVRLWLSGPGDAAALLAGAPAAARERTELLGVGDASAQHERYGRAWVTCLPSTHDSFGMALLESLACGTPLVTTTHSAPQELVDEGVTGRAVRAPRTRPRWPPPACAGWRWPAGRRRPPPAGPRPSPTTGTRGWRRCASACTPRPL